MTQKEYIDAWDNNAKQHYNNQDYEWLCGKIKLYKNILELGCGSGYSTLSLAQNGHQVLSIDCNSEALKKTSNLLHENRYLAKTAIQFINFSEADYWLWNINAVENRETVTEVIKQLPTDLIILCNPGGNLHEHIYKYEVELLLKYGFSKEEINSNLNDERIPLLHKYAMIDAAVEIAIDTEKPLLLVDRGERDEVEEVLNRVEIDAGIKKVFDDFRKINREPVNGIQLGSANNKNGLLFWGAGIYRGNGDRLQE